MEEIPAGGRIEGDPGTTEFQSGWVRTTDQPGKPVEMSAEEIANQLGLKLEPSQGQVEVLVIDHIERPSPN